MYTDPTGACVGRMWRDPTCQFVGWDRVQRGNLAWAEGRPWGGAAIDFVPVVGDIKGLIEVFTGCDLVTGEDLGAWRWAGLLFLGELRQLRHADTVVGALRVGADAARGRDTLSFVSDMVRVAQARTIYQNTWDWQGSPYTIAEMTQTWLWRATGRKQVIRFSEPWELPSE